MILNEETLQQLRKLSECEAIEWIGMLKEIGEDPKTFFENGIWKNVDFSMSNMNGVSFKGAIVENSKFRAEDIISLQISEAVHFTTAPISNTVSQNRRGSVSLLDYLPQGELYEDVLIQLLEFEEELKKQKVAYFNDGSCSFESLTRVVSGLEEFRYRFWGLGACLKELPPKPDRQFIRAVVGDLDKVQLSRELSAIAMKENVSAKHFLQFELCSSLAGCWQFIDSDSAEYISADVRILNRLSSLTRNVKELRTLFGVLLSAGVKIDRRLFEQFAFTHDFAKWDDLIELMKSCGIQPDDTFFLNVATKKMSALSCLALVKCMSALGFNPDCKLISLAAANIKNVKLLSRFLRESGAKKFSIEVSAFDGVCLNADPDKMVEILGLMNLYEADYGIATFNTFARNCKSLLELREVLAMMAKIKLEPDIRTFQSFVDGSLYWGKRQKPFRTGDLFRLMEEFGLPPLQVAMNP